LKIKRLNHEEHEGHEENQKPFFEILSSCSSFLRVLRDRFDLQSRMELSE